MMAKREWVDGEGYISDDSSFCGDEQLNSHYETVFSSRLEHAYWPPVAVQPYKRPKHVGSGHDIASSQPQSAIKCEPSEDDEGSSKRHPQLNSIQTTHIKSATPTELERPDIQHGKLPTDPVKVDNFKDHPAAWQQSETVASFLQRLPVGDAATALVGPWLWVGRPYVSYSHSIRQKSEEIDTFIASGMELLAAFDLQRGKIEGDNPGKVAATITRKLAPYRDQLEGDLLTLAVKMGKSNGKWMLFPNHADLARVWQIVATATAGGKLGPLSKVATLDPTKSDTLICIYTYDFSDFEDVRRVLNQLVDLGLCHADGKPVYYKCDAYTYLNISSGNPYKLRASLYSSKEVLHNEVKALESGPVAKMKRRDKGR